MGLFKALRERIRQAFARPATIAERAAPLVQARLRLDATTRRGNIPQFAPGAKGHPGPTIPIVARAQGSDIVVTGPGWVMDKANERGQPKEWANIVRDVAKRGS